mmetsp:Transcript_82743/g.159904  ORF Transcript_82743/g.159904 Transcript_82743/m.159904 type:complete len:90 (+) Transcript_82743:59-328(+)
MATAHQSMRAMAPEEVDGASIFAGGAIYICFHILEALRWFGLKLGKQRGKRKLCINVCKSSNLKLRPSIGRPALARKLASSVRPEANGQ